MVLTFKLSGPCAWNGGGYRGAKAAGQVLTGAAFWVLLMGLIGASHLHGLLFPA